MSMSAQPLVIITGTTSEQHSRPVPALLIELGFRDAAMPLMQSSVRADRCRHVQGEMVHMFTADGCTVLYQSPASQLYMGHACTCLDSYLGLSMPSDSGSRPDGGSPSKAMQQQVQRQWVDASAAAAAAPATATNWLQELFALDVSSLRQMMATTSEGGVWR